MLNVKKMVFKTKLQQSIQCFVVFLSRACTSRSNRKKHVVFRLKCQWMVKKILFFLHRRGLSAIVRHNHKVFYNFAI